VLQETLPGDHYCSGCNPVISTDRDQLLAKMANSQSSYWQIAKIGIVK